MKANVLLCILILMLFSCVNQNPTRNSTREPLPYPHTVNIDQAIEKTGTIKLSEIADSIKYLVLSKDKKVLTKRFLYLEMTDNDIFIQIGSLIHRFDNKGTFLNTIGQIGRGPEEYLNGSMFSINTSSNSIYVYRNFLKDFISYDFSGKFLKSLPFRFNHDIGSFISLSDTALFIYPVYFGIAPDDMFLCGIFNLDGEKIQTIKHPAQKIPTDFNPSKFIVGGPWANHTFFNNELIAICDLDTIHKTSKSSLYNAFIFNWGNLLRPKTYEEKYYIGGRPENAIANPRKLFETTTKAFILINDQFDYQLIEFDKRNSSSRSMVLHDPYNLGFINDLDNGSNFYPEWTNRKGNIWIKATEAIDFINLHNSLSNKDFDANLKSFLSELQIDDNTVLELVYLKQ